MFRSPTAKEAEVLKTVPRGTEQGSQCHHRAFAVVARIQLNLHPRVQLENDSDGQAQRGQSLLSKRGVCDSTLFLQNFGFGETL